MSSRSRSRQFAVQMIYQQNFADEEPEVIFPKFWNSNDADEKTRNYAEHLVMGVLDHRDEMEMQIMHFLQGWSLERIATTDRYVLQLALFELIHHKDIPWKVVVNEACTLAKMFSGEQSINFINGILHNWCEHNGVAEPRKAGQSVPPPVIEPEDDGQDENDSENNAESQA